MARTTEPRKMEGTIVPQPNPEIDDALGTPQEVIAARPGANDTISTGPKTFESVIGNGITACMIQRTAHMDVEKEMDEWFRNLPANKTERLEKLRMAREQIETARLAIEAFYSRFRTMASTAKN